MANSDVSLHPITAVNSGPVASFLHENLNTRVSSEAWQKLLAPPWADTGPNHGFQLLSEDGTVVGVYVAVYSRREVDGITIAVCNLAAFCVLEDFRTHSLRLIRAILKQPGFVFVDLSPSGNVVAMNERLGFQHLDTSTRLVVNLPHAPTRHGRLTQDPATLDRVLRGRDALVYRDHRHALAVEHLLVEREGEYGYLMFRRDRRKGLRLFATPLYAGGSIECIEGAWGAIRSRLLRKGLFFTLAERRVLGFSRGPGIDLRHPRPRMFRGSGIDAHDIDYLYSELALVAW